MAESNYISSTSNPVAGNCQKALPGHRRTWKLSLLCQGGEERQVLVCARTATEVTDDAVEERELTFVILKSFSEPALRGLWSQFWSANPSGVNKCELVCMSVNQYRNVFRFCYRTTCKSPLNTTHLGRGGKAGRAPGWLGPMILEHTLRKNP